MWVTSLLPPTLHLVLLASLGLASDLELEGEVTLRLEHSLDMGASWEPRGTLSLSRARTAIPSITQNSLNKDSMERMKNLCSKNELYLIKLSGDGGDELLSYAPACGLLDSSLAEQLTIFMDWRGNLVAANLASRNNVQKVEKSTGKFDTRVQVQNMETGPTPDTAAYIQKMEEEKSRKMSGEKQENKSFFAKYWMYIVPLCIIMLINSAGAPENGGGGGR